MSKQASKQARFPSIHAHGAVPSCRPRQILTRQGSNSSSFNLQSWRSHRPSAVKPIAPTRCSCVVPVPSRARSPIHCIARPPVATSAALVAGAVQGPQLRAAIQVSCRREPRTKQPSRSPVILTGDHQRGPSPLLHASAEGPLGRQQRDPYIAVWTPPLSSRTALLAATVGETVWIGARSTTVAAVTQLGGCISHEEAASCPAVTAVTGRRRRDPTARRGRDRRRGSHGSNPLSGDLARHAIIERVGARARAHS